MPVIVERVSQQLSTEMSEQLLKVYADSPEFDAADAAVNALNTALNQGATVYAGVFNKRAVAAVLVSGEGDTRQMRYLCVHPATRGRGVADRLVSEVRRLEAENGVTWIEAAFDVNQKGVPQMLESMGFIERSAGLHRARV